MAVLFGLAIAGGMATEEGVAPQLLLFFAVAACGMYAFVVAAGAYLRVIGAATVIALARATVIACACACACPSVPLAVAFRSWPWWIIGASDATAGFAQLGTLLVLVGIGTFGVAFVVESLAPTLGEPVNRGALPRRHDDPSDPPTRRQ